LSVEASGHSGSVNQSEADDWRSGEHIPLRGMGPKELVGPIPGPNERVTELFESPLYVLKESLTLP